MTVSERKLEEDEAKIDNLLHKIISSNQKIDYIRRQITKKSSNSEVHRLADMIGILTETIDTLADLADRIDLDDEKITEELEIQLKDQLNRAIKNINDAEEILK